MRIRDFWQSALKPSSSVTNPYKKQQAKLLLSILILVLPLGIIGALLPPLITNSNPFSNTEDISYALFGLPIWLIIFLLAKTRFYKISAWLALITGIVLIMVATIPDQDYEDLFYSVFVLIFSSQFFTGREIIITFFITLISLVFIPLLDPNPDLWNGVYYPLTMILLAGVLAILDANNLIKIGMIQNKEMLAYEHRFRSLLQYSNWGTAIIENQEIKECDQTFAGILHYQPEELIGVPITQLINIPNANLTSHDTVETYAVPFLGGTLHVEMLAHNIHLGIDQVSFIAIRNITSRKRMEESLKNKANRYPLTKLYNRDYLMQYLDSQINTTHDKVLTSVLFIDLNQFKEVNDKHGHEMGDHLLYKIACRLQEVVRDEDVVARYGGDEFVIVCQCPIDVSNTIAQRAGGALREPIKANGILFSVGASIGIVHNIQLFKHAAEVLRAADDAMYWAKNKSKTQPKGKAVIAIWHPKIRKKSDSK